MNKYQKALDYFIRWLNPYEEDYNHDKYLEHKKNLRELIDKATPKKPIRFKNSIYISNPKCPICQTIPHTGNQKYCVECGQKLDWSDE